MTTMSLIVPCYNERDGIRHLLQVVEELQRRLGASYALELIVVDDGSTDGTVERLEAELIGTHLNASVIRHPRNQGLGAAIRTGFTHARGELIATTDSDCTYDPLAVVSMLALLEQGADVVTGSAHHPRGGARKVPAGRLFLSRSCSRLYNLVLGARISTYTSLMRLYRAEVIRSIRFESDNFLAVTEILVRALMRGYRVAEHPMTLTMRNSGISKAVIVRIIRDHLRFLWWLVRHGVRIRAGTTLLPMRTEGSEEMRRLSFASETLPLRAGMKRSHEDREKPRPLGRGESLIDTKGRLFGRWNIIDVGVVTAIVAMGYGLFITTRVLSGELRRPPPATAGTVAQVIVYADVMLRELAPDLVEQIRVGDVERDNEGRPVATIVWQGKLVPDFIELGFGKISVEADHPSWLRLPVVMQLVGEARGGTFFFRGRLIGVGSTITFHPARYRRVTGMILNAFPRAGETLKAPE